MPSAPAASLVEADANSEAGDAVADGGDVATLVWLDLDEDGGPDIGHGPGPASPRASGRPTAVKSMPFRPPDLLPTDIIVSTGPWLSTAAKRPPPLPRPDGKPAGPPPKAAKISAPAPLPPAAKPQAAAKPPPQVASAPVEDAVVNGAGFLPEEGLVDPEGRPYDSSVVIVNFTSVGSTFVRTMSAVDPLMNYRFFDWEGVRQCVHHLKFTLGLKVIGVIFKGLAAPDMASEERHHLPFDIRMMCESLEVAKEIAGLHPRRASAVKTLELAYQNNCRFVSDDVGRLLQRRCSAKCRTWLDRCRRLLLMRYFFTSKLGAFETPDGDSLL